MVREVTMERASVNRRKLITISERPAHVLRCRVGRISSAAPVGDNEDRPHSGIGQIPPILLHDPGGASGPPLGVEAENSSFG